MFQFTNLEDFMRFLHAKNNPESEQSTNEEVDKAAKILSEIRYIQNHQKSIIELDIEQDVFVTVGQKGKPDRPLRVSGKELAKIMDILTTDAAEQLANLKSQFEEIKL